MYKYAMPWVFKWSTLEGHAFNYCEDLSIDSLFCRSSSLSTVADQTMLQESSSGQSSPRGSTYLCVHTMYICSMYYMYLYVQYYCVLSMYRYGAELEPWKSDTPYHRFPKLLAEFFSPRPQGYEESCRGNGAICLRAGPKIAQLCY